MTLEDDEGKLPVVHSTFLGILRRRIALRREQEQEEREIEEENAWIYAHLYPKRGAPSNANPGQAAQTPPLDDDEVSYLPFGEVTPEQIADYNRMLTDPKTKHRRVLRHWPRDPNGNVLTHETSKLGKMHPNGIQFWGATLFDFYLVRRVPKVAACVTLSTGSKLAAWMKEQGETIAKDELQRAEREPEPSEVKPYPTIELVKEVEPRIPWNGQKRELEFGLYLVRGPLRRRNECY